MEKVMIFTPYNGRLEPETVAAVLALEWDGPLRWVWQQDNPHGLSRESHLHQFARGRELFLAGDDDAMLIIESDIIPPPDALKKLMALKADVAYGVYCFRVGRHAWPFNTPINIFERYPGEARNEGEPLSSSARKLASALRQRIVPCSGAGFGCTLIRRSVLAQISFRLQETAHCDTWFTQDVYRAKMKMMADMSVVCGHKDTDGFILWPPFDAEGNKR
jgi:hypothetical protein